MIVCEVFIELIGLYWRISKKTRQVHVLYTVSVCQSLCWHISVFLWCFSLVILA